MKRAGERKNRIGIGFGRMLMMMSRNGGCLKSWQPAMLVWNVWSFVKVS